MQEASKIEIGRLSSGFNLMPRFGYSLRPIVPALLQTDQTAPATHALLTILLLVSLNAFMIGSGVTQTRSTGWQMKRRDAILDAMSYAAQQFLGNAGWEK